MLKTGGAFSNFMPEASAPLWSASLEIHSFFISLILWVLELLSLVRFRLLWLKS